jgi:putative sterol carrier protein
MPSFADADELQHYVGGIFDKAFADPEIGPKMRDTKMVIATECTDPNVTLVIDLGNARVHRGGEGPVPDAVLKMSGDTANAYWQGKLNLPLALVRKKVKLEGDIAKLLALAPFGSKLYPQYVEMLRGDGREDLVV